jgi:hypothetical protein
LYRGSQNTFGVHVLFVKVSFEIEKASFTFAKVKLAFQKANRGIVNINRGSPLKRTCTY